MRSFLEALVIVLFVSFVALGWRTGIVVALSVPLVLAIVFIVMNVMSIDLHRITLGALIIALGLLVDDAIIAVEMMVVKMEQGWDRAKAASFAWESTAFPMLTGTLVTVAGFLPIGFANSSVGEYAGGIFWIVAIALVASWFVAVIFTPYIGVKLLPDFAGQKGHNPDEVYHTRIYRTLRAGDSLVRQLSRHGGADDGRPLRRWRWSASAMPSSSSSRCRSGRNCSCSCAIRKAPRSTSRWRPSKQAEATAEGRQGHHHLHRLCRQGLAAVLDGAQSATAERILRRDRDRHQGRRGARAGQGADRSRPRRTAS